MSATLFHSSCNKGRCDPRSFIDNGKVHFIEPNRIIILTSISFKTRDEYFRSLTSRQNVMYKNVYNHLLVLGLKNLIKYELWFRYR